MARITFKNLLFATIPVAAVAKGISYFMGEMSPLCFLLPLIGIAVVGSIVFTIKNSYQPPENHLGVIYRLGRFHRFVNPDEYILLFPLLDHVHREIDLYMRTAEIFLENVELQDGLAVDMRFKVFFKVDPRLTNPENFLQVLKFEGHEWTEIVKTGIEDIARNQVFLALDQDLLNTMRRNRSIKKMMSKEIAIRLKGFGYIINEEHGVMLVNVRQNRTYFEAIQKSKAATPLGNAALDRLRPVLDALKHMRHEDARSTLLLELASKIVEADELPDVFLTSSDEKSIPNIINKDRREKPEKRDQTISAIKKLPLAN